MEATSPTASNRAASTDEGPDPLPSFFTQVRPWLPTQALDAVRLALAVVVAIYLAMLFQLEIPTWAGWTVLSVTLATRASSLQKCLWRIVGSLVGGVVGIMLVASFAQSTLAFDVAMALWLGFAGFMASCERGQRSYGFALMGFTVPIITLGNVDHPAAVFLTAVDRCTTIVLGIVCAHASAILVQADVRVVRRSLADAVDGAIQACEDWIAHGAVSTDPPVTQVLALDDSIADAFVEQPSLRTGADAFSGAPLALLRLLATRLLEVRLAGVEGAMAAELLGPAFAEAVDRVHRFPEAVVMLRAGRRHDLRRPPVQGLGLDRDLRQAVRDGARSAAAVSAVSAFWYVSHWPSGGTATTWVGLISVLNAARPNPSRFTRDFLIGAALAALVGITLHYTALATTGGGFGELAAVVLPLGIIAALGRSDKRALSGSGFSFFILTALDPTNVMSYGFDDSLNSVFAAQFGMAAAMVAFAAFPPPVTEEVRRRRTMHRLAAGVRAVAVLPRPVRPRADLWLGRMFMRLHLIEKAEASARRSGEDLILMGALILALREEDERFGREVGAAALSGRASLPILADRQGLSTLQRGRTLAVEGLLGRTSFSPGWNHR